MQTTLAQSSPYIDMETGQFKALFNQRSFEFGHGLASHPLFELPRLLKLAESNPSTYYDAGEITINQRWKDRPRAKATLAETFDNIHNAGAWVVIRHAERHPECREVLDGFLTEVERLSGLDLAEEKKSQEAILFVTSPNRLTSFHIDRECNFLLQVSGEKEISIFDRSDREVVTEQELERFWTVDNDAAVYRPELQTRARAYTLRPGSAVHIPVNAAHWLKNGNNVSVSASFSFQFRDEARANLYRTNHYLRKLGFNPQVPGSFAALDDLKRSRAVARVTSSITRTVNFPAYCVWRLRELKNKKLGKA